MSEQPSQADENFRKDTALQGDELIILRKELEREKENANDYLNQLKYLQADFENYKKRVKKEIDESAQYSNRRLILELLPVLDELECAVEAGRECIDKAFLEGVEMTLNKLYSILKKEGLSKIEAKGKTFDPNKHEAVNRVQVEGKDGVIVGEVRKGFMLKDAVIRPSLVTVAVDISKKGEKE
ncbi:MAG: nucleotide exchange factor GrpE [Candidatus Bathyarchaeota archaeon]